MPILPRDRGPSLDPHVDLLKGTADQRVGCQAKDPRHKRCWASTAAGKGGVNKGDGKGNDAAGKGAVHKGKAKGKAAATGTSAAGERKGDDMGGVAVGTGAANKGGGKEKTDNAAGNGNTAGGTGDQPGIATLELREGRARGTMARECLNWWGTVSAVMKCGDCATELTDDKGFDSVERGISISDARHAR